MDTERGSTRASAREQHGPAQRRPLSPRSAMASAKASGPASKMFLVPPFRHSSCTRFPASSRSLASSAPGRWRSRTCGPNPSSTPSRFRKSYFFRVSKPRMQYTQGRVEERIPIVSCRQRRWGTFARATMRASEMKTQSPSGSRGRAGVRISNLPPWLSLLCMVIYIKEESTMQISVSSTLTVFHDGQFWVGLAEHVEDGRYGVARIVFGAEPSNEEILQFVISKWAKLTFFGGNPAEASEPAKTPSAAPARRRRPLNSQRWAPRRSRRSRVRGRQ